MKFFLCTTFVWLAHYTVAAEKRRKPLERLVGAATHDANVPNYTCEFFEQPLNHFALPRDTSPTYRQRFCFNDDYVQNISNATIFFYTGNESPVDQYINNTGLMWELAAEFNAQIVFAEHRYEGESLPSNDLPNCMAYSSSIQALADYARLIESHLFRQNNESSSIVHPRPVIAFGGSYGGMLTAWMRMKYPNLITGGIAGSAPIFGFPLDFPSQDGVIDSAFQVITRAMGKNYPPTETADKENYCATNLLASYPLIHYLASKGPSGRDVLKEAFRSCSPLAEKDAPRLISWAQTPWFDLAEGSFPYPSSYIPFALTHDDNVKLPAWPLQAACWNFSDLAQDLGVTFSGDLDDVRYNVSYAKSGLVLTVDWDKVTVAREPVPVPDFFNTSVSTLLENVRAAVAVWYNMTNDLSCFEILPAPNAEKEAKSSAALRRKLVQRKKHNAQKACSQEMSQGSWDALCCNEEMNLVITDAQGLGRDFKWPPSHPRGTSTYADIVRYRGNDYSDSICPDPHGYFGYPKTPPDAWSTKYDIFYGGTRISSQSNIIFSNGKLDPWSAAGVYAFSNNSRVVVPGLQMQNINDRDMIALIMEYGGHHTDLMFSSDDDPASITEARAVEKRYISKWIDEFWSTFGGTRYESDTGY